MNTPQSQIKLNIPAPLKKHLEYKAGKFGMPLAGYVRFLILKDVENLDFITYEASEASEQAYTSSVNEKKTGKLTKTKDLKKFLQNLK